MQNGSVFPPVAQPYASPQVDEGMAQPQPGNGMHIQMLPIEPPNEPSHGGAASIPVAVPNKSGEENMQAKPGIFTNQRGNLKVSGSVPSPCTYFINSCLTSWPFLSFGRAVCCIRGPVPMLLLVHRLRHLHCNCHDPCVSQSAVIFQFFPIWAWYPAPLVCGRCRPFLLFIYNPSSHVHTASCPHDHFTVFKPPDLRLQVQQGMTVSRPS